MKVLASISMFTITGLMVAWLGAFPSYADSRCGEGYVCWESFGGQKAVVQKCRVLYSSGGSPYCANQGLEEEFCNCDGSPTCQCTLTTNVTCAGQPVSPGSNCLCSSGDEVFGACDPGGTCVYGEPVWEGEATCEGAPAPIQSGCCLGESPTPTPTPGGSGGGSGGGGENGGQGATPTPTPYFTGYVFEDANAIPQGLGGSDNICTGSTSSPVAARNGTVSVIRLGEQKAKVLTSSSYSIATNSNNNDYSVTLDLPFPPEDPDNPWQCACNADPTDPYRCRYTNQQPNDGLVNFFIKRGGSTNTAWFQTLGGSSWADRNIESVIPATTCTPPTCTPALIAADAVGTTNSAGFPLSNSGVVVTSDSGETYIHESDSRDVAVQAKGLGVVVPVENYDYFYDKFGEQSQTLSGSDKPVVGSDLEVFKYTGDLTIDETDGWNLSNTEQIVVFFDGNLIIDDAAAGENRITTVATGGNGFLMFIANGDITFTSNVGYSDIQTDATQANIANVEGVFVADGVLTIAGQAGATDRKFIGAGTFVGWGGVDLQRNFDDGDSPELNNNAATETFIFRPDLLINAPKEIKSAQMTWREIAPTFH